MSRAIQVCDDFDNVEERLSARADGSRRESENMEDDEEEGT